MNTENNDLSPIEAMTNAITDIGLPEPIKKNFFKAMGQLCTSAIEVPAAYLDGIAAERRAETHARIKLIEKSANQIAAQMEFDPEYAKLAVKKFGQKIIREQVNLDLITSKATKDIQISFQEKEDTTSQSEEKTISDDWLNTFEKEASQKSTEEMQTLFARILAGEIKSPESYSIKALKTLGDLNSEVANLFAKFCSCCMVLQVPSTNNSSHIIDARICSLGGNAGSNNLQSYGFSFSNLNLLHEYGLIIPDYNSWMNYHMAILLNQPILPFSISKRYWALIPTPEAKEKIELKITGVALSQVGKELYSIVDTIINDQYISSLSDYFNTLDLKLTDITENLRA
ncbi:MAG: DUF2806 domain-containing protein [Thiothrix sp.]|uniref:DUF2806 domain-containing protein n=1 Tax=Thiothrix sp. TaxID=1032 RepID=UPI0026019E2F|nr:DUF2806 domain-containing protein [Thiothrix sp.]MDD5393697.1 DUF2806 domain-containing protein [Thiothrix sp.]